MSSRALRKAKQAEEKVQGKDESSEEEATGGVIANAFDLLDGNAGADSEDDEEEQKPKPQQPSSKSKKKNRKKKPVAATTTPQQPEKEQNKDKEKEKEEEDEIDEIFQENYANENKGTQVATALTFDKLFAPNSAHLDAESEMKNLFGSNVIREAKQQQQRNARQQNPHSNPHNYNPKYSIITPDPTWPSIHVQEKFSTVSGISIQHANSKNGVDYFEVVLLPEYQKLEKVYQQCVQTGDPSTLSALLLQYPYHVHSLLQLSDACKITGQLDVAVQFIKQIVYRFEACWYHPVHSKKSTTTTNPTNSSNNNNINNNFSGKIQFSPLTKSCRFEYKVKDNRPFHIALFKYIQVLDRQGCSRTAFELCKILLNFDVSDPVGVLLIIDNFSLRSQDYSFLLTIFFDHVLQQQPQQQQQQGETGLAADFAMVRKRITCLPNWAFSVALASFLNSADDGESKNKNKKNNKNKSNSNNNNNYSKSADDLLKAAILSFPDVALALAAKLGVNLQITAPPQSPAQSSTLSMLSTLFVEKNHSLWKKPNVIQWIKRVAININNNTMNDIVIQRDPLDPSLFYRHVLLSENKEVQSQLPREVQQKGLDYYDDDAYNITNAQPQQQQQQQQQGQQQAQGMSYTDSLAAASQILALFLHSLLPTDTYNPLARNNMNNNNNNMGISVNSLGGPHGYVAHLLRDVGLDVNYHVPMHFQQHDDLPENNNPGGGAGGQFM